MLMLPGCAAGMHCSGPQLEFAYSIFIGRNNRTCVINYQLSWAVFGLIFRVIFSLLLGVSFTAAIL